MYSSSWLARSPETLSAAAIAATVAHAGPDRASARLPSYGRVITSTRAFFAGTLAKYM